MRNDQKATDPYIKTLSNTNLLRQNSRTTNRHPRGNHIILKASAIKSIHFPPNKNIQKNPQLGTLKLTI